MNAELNVELNLDSNVRRDVVIQWHGQTSFDQGASLQVWARERVSVHQDEIFLLGMEHFEVVTLGRRLHSLSESAWQNLSSRPPAPSTLLPVSTMPPIPTRKIQRGGEATLHNLGQLVIYPIISLRTHRLSVKSYIRLLLETTTRALHKIGVTAYEDLSRPGVYSACGSKIGFIGIGVTRGITQHGISINIKNDLAPFSFIRACGQSDARLTSAQLQGVTIEPKAFFQIWTEIWAVKWTEKSTEMPPKFS